VKFKSDDAQRNAQQKKYHNNQRIKYPQSSQSLQQKTTTGRPTHLFEDEEVEKDHAEVVDDEGLAELEGLAVLHVLGPQPEEEQIGAADGQGGQGVVHQGPFLHPLVCRGPTHKVKHTALSDFKIYAFKPFF